MWSKLFWWSYLYLTSLIWLETDVIGSCSVFLEFLDSTNLPFQSINRKWTFLLMYPWMLSLLHNSSQCLCWYTCTYRRLYLFQIDWIKLYCSTFAIFIRFPICCSSLQNFGVESPSFRFYAFWFSIIDWVFLSIHLLFLVCEEGICDD